MGELGALLICIAIAGCIVTAAEGRQRPQGAPFLPEGTGTAVFCVAVLVGAYFLGGQHQ